MSDLLDGPPKHLERFAPPWATDRRTICGRPLGDVAAWVTFDEGRKLITKIGQSRARIIFCQTCVNSNHAIQRPETWNHNPVRVVNDYTRHHWDKSPAFDQTRAELLALAKLVADHRDEYQAIVTAYRTDELTARRLGTRKRSS